MHYPTHKLLALTIIDYRVEQSSFIHSLTHSLIHSLAHSFTHSSIHSVSQGSDTSYDSLVAE